MVPTATRQKKTSCHLTPESRFLKSISSPVEYVRAIKFLTHLNPMFSLMDDSIN